MTGKSIRSHFRFSLRTILLFVMLAAIFIPVCQWLHNIINSRPIELAIEEFENLQYEHYENLTPLTSGEVLDYLESDAEMIQQSPARAKRIFSQIVNTKRIPNTVKFDMVTYRSGRKPGIDAVLVRMVITDGNFWYSVDIRTIEATPEMQPGMMWDFASQFPI